MRFVLKIWKYLTTGINAPLLVHTIILSVQSIRLWIHTNKRNKKKQAWSQICMEKMLQNVHTTTIKTWLFPLFPELKHLCLVFCPLAWFLESHLWHLLKLKLVPTPSRHRPIRFCGLLSRIGIWIRIGIRWFYPAGTFWYNSQCFGSLALEIVDLFLSHNKFYVDVLFQIVHFRVNGLF